MDPGWLRRFEDESLNQLVLEAERHNPDLKIAASQVAQAVEQARIAASAARPNASLGMGARRTRQNFIGFPDFGGGGNGPGGGEPPAEETVLQNLSNSFGPSLDIAWELDVWGRVRQSEAAAMAQAEAAAMDFAAARTSLVAQVAKGWFALAESEEHNRLADETLRATEETERALGDRFRAGQAEGQIVGAQYRLAKSDTEAARAALDARRRSPARRRATAAAVVAACTPSEPWAPARTAVAMARRTRRRRRAAARSAPVVVAAVVATRTPPPPRAATAARAR